MKTIFRDRTVIEKMDYELAGDRPISHFILTAAEIHEFIGTGDRARLFNNNNVYYEYKGIPVYQERT